MPKDIPHPVIQLYCQVTTYQYYKCGEFLKQKYEVEKLSLSQIASECGASKDSVRKGLVENGIRLRSAHQNHGRPSQPRFGKRLIKGSEVEFKHEQRVIEAIVRMRKEGLSLRAIARCLTEMRVSTKCRGKKWHPEMVSRVLVAYRT